MKTVGSGELDTAALETAGGVGIVVTAEDIKAAVDKVFSDKKDEIIANRYRTPIGSLNGAVKAIAGKWADGKAVMDAINAALLALLGPKTEEDMKKPEKVKKPKEKKKPAESKEEKKEEGVAQLKKFPMPEENTRNKPEMLAQHLKETGGKIVTRFPPEPNGFLHIGHAKAMGLSFSYAKLYEGICYLRFDDTNPEGETEEFKKSIEEMVRWLGWNPFKITYASDHFDTLYEIAIKLIKKGLAYIDHSNGDEIKAQREKMENSPWRDRPVEESLALFEDMRAGKIEEGKATLRLKMDMKSENYCMRDLIAYRIKFQSHPHTGDKWCIYPTYDYTHCLCDSLENITHSLCTLEFEVRQESYYWLLDAAEMYKPLVWEYSRLNIGSTVMSKRKLKQLVNENKVRGWDDPRLPTLSGMRRRGYTADAINNFVRAIGISRNENLIRMQNLEHHVRVDLDEKANRVLAVLDPLKITLTDMPADQTLEFEANNHPKDTTRGTRKLALSNVVYIDRADWRDEDVKGYFGLAPGKEVLLRNAFNITCTEVIKDNSGRVVEIKATHDPEKKNKVKGVLHWVSSPAGQSPPRAEVRLYDSLLTVEDPSEMAGAANWLDFVNKESEVVVTDALIEAAAAALTPLTPVQFERVGFFTVDTDSTADKPVFNRTVTLREAKSKGGK
eukprot:TRINITY_DN832_c2_g1_i2.p1 TRINITY_DN832_c2_g1~~TRINITY_DN832_c2_g1_i2.p1  ORF type:complete len:672 (+),score=249.33 TRINITY_DN832_c2_g1_i2:504-2519(+)